MALVPIISSLVAAAWVTLPAVCLIGIVEVVIGVRSRQHRPWSRALVFWTLTALIVAVDRPLIGLTLSFLHAGNPLVAHVSGPVAWVAVGVGGAVLGDFFFYWLHRAYHAWPLLWRFHSLHHSIRDLDAVNSWHHWLEDITVSIFVLAPLALFFPSMSGVTLGAFVLRLQGVFIHSNSRLSLWPLGWLVVDNRFHRLHHSVEPKHLNKNFGAFTPIWDVLFGTAYFPARDEWPATGLDGVPEPETVVAFLARPFSFPASTT